MRKFTVSEFYEDCQRRGFDTYIYCHETQAAFGGGETQVFNAEFDDMAVTNSPMGGIICFKLDKRASLDFRWVKYIAVNSGDSGEKYCVYHIFCEKVGADFSPSLVEYNILATKS